MWKQSRRDELKSVVEKFLNISIELATGGHFSYEDWEAARGDLLSQPELLRILPDWIASCRWGGQYWPFIRDKFPTYAARREFLYESLAPVLDAVEHGATQPTAISLESVLRSCSSGTVSEAWARIQARRESDPEGAITAARALLESTCKYVLDQLGVGYGPSEELPKLYGKAAAAMNLSPETHNEQVLSKSSVAATRPSTASPPCATHMAMHMVRQLLLRAPELGMRTWQSISQAPFRRSSLPLLRHVINPRRRRQPNISLELTSGQRSYARQIRPWPLAAQFRR